MPLLDEIHGPVDIRKLNDSQLQCLCEEIRGRLIEVVSKTGGHLSSNLGAVELTLAIHRVFDTEKDRIVFDVGHQSYVHKILTGRNDRLDTLRKLDGLSGFPNPEESVHDAFIAGHASNAVSAALGMARARTLQGQDYSVVALMGDGALTGGLAYEALNDLGQSGEPLVVILNDNGMSIGSNVGGVARYLAKQRMKPAYFTFKKNYRQIMKKLPGGKVFYRFTHRIKSALKNAILHCSMFEDMGMEYLGPVDGYDLNKLTYFLSWARDLKKPVLVHVHTRKGKGVDYAEENPDLYHGVGPFDPQNGEATGKKKDFSAIFGETLSELAEQDQRICAVTAAMQDGTGLTDFARQHRARFFDVGIAEEHAVTMSAGLAKQGMKPVFAVYSSFLQRAYDMLIHDVSIQKLPVVFAVDRAGICGADGVTHQGLFDVGFLSQVPGMTLLAPASFAELRSLLATALKENCGPAALRYPRGGEGEYKGDSGLEPCLLREGGDLTIISHGIAINDALRAAALLETQGISAAVLKVTCLCPLNMEPIAQAVSKTGRILVYEHCAEAGCLGQKILSELEKTGGRLKKAKLMNFGAGLIPHGETEQLKARFGMDDKSIAAAAAEMME